MTWRDSESIKRSGGGVSEQKGTGMGGERGVYQAFRWWGVGTYMGGGGKYDKSLSSVPVVGCRNADRWRDAAQRESIKRSGGGVSELTARGNSMTGRVYQAFRWWGVGTAPCMIASATGSLSSVPVVGCRNRGVRAMTMRLESIKRSGGGVSEHLVMPLGTRS